MGGGWLPPTNFLYGRRSAPRSHWLYQLDHGLPSRKWLDPLEPNKDANTILELRCLKKDGTVGFQTIVPPSLHPSGEQLFFHTHGEPAKFKADELLRRCSHMAAACLLARHWPGEKSGRNEAFLALAGTLARAGFSAAEAVRIHQTIYTILWDTAADLKQAEAEVAATYEKFQRDEPVTGYSRLSELLPDAVVKSATCWLGVKDEDARVGGAETSVAVESDFPETDLGNAQRFIERHGTDIRWCEAWSCWLYWDGRRWLRDDRQVVHGKAQGDCCAFYSQAGEISDQFQRKRLVDHARRCEHRQRIEAMMAEARPMAVVGPDDLDRDIWPECR